MRHFPRVETIGQSTTPDERDDFLQSVREVWTMDSRLPDQWREHFSRYEQIKTPEEKRLINIAGNITNTFVERHGGSGFEIIESRVHLLPKDTLSHIPQFQVDGGGVSFPFAGRIILVTDIVRKHPIHFLKVLIHEEIHVKSYLSAMLGEKGGLRRRGFSTPRSSDSKNNLFVGLDEALTEEGAYDCLIEAMSDSRLSAVSRHVRSEAGSAARTQYAERNYIPRNEVLWALPDGSDGGSLVYFPQRQTFEFIQEKLLIDNPIRLSKPAEVRALFYRAKFQGNLLPVARLIEQSFGEGAFRVVADMSGGTADWSCLKELIKRRKKIEAERSQVI